MAERFYLRDGLPPNNISYTEEIRVAQILEQYGEMPERYGFLATSFKGDHPWITLDKKRKPAHESANTIYIVLKIEDTEAGSKQFPKPGFYVVLQGKLDIKRN